MEQLKEYAHHYHDGMITAGEFLYKVVVHLTNQTPDVPLTQTQHDLADKLSDQLLKD